jgi:2-succinyl-6-hydroxy-2,4-cyclohexadiene-1-carboxylate synthase
MRCVLLHGFAGAPAMWDDVIAAWPLPGAPAASLRAVALPGHGGGPVRATWHDNLAAVGDALGGCDVVIGYSLGARVALGLIATGRYPRAVLIGVNPGLPADERPARRERDAAWARLLRTQGVAAFAAAWTAQPLFASQARAPTARRAARHALRLALDPESLARSLEVMGLAEMPDYRDTFAVHRDRLALIAGAEDTTYAAIARALPASSCELIDACGHDPTLEQPHALAAAIGRAVTRLAGA